MLEELSLVKARQEAERMKQEKETRRLEAAAAKEKAEKDKILKI